MYGVSLISRYMAYPKESQRDYDDFGEAP